MQTNHVESKITISYSDREDELNQVDLLIAYILANPLVDLSEYLFKRIKSDGKIVLSDIL
ncbi:50S ribosomal protein L11 methyltransferase [Candidatus Ruthturnera calyptogenae]|uniref:50S ribosomal protein L11 methyltransferase n=1 Tax=Candidatus Ruthturnera calyptogenae TaxID=386487 RepID=UPI0009D72382